jgi:excisionase family DNA binding protein
MDTMWTVSDIAKTMQVSRIWVYKLVREKKIPFYHIEKCVRFDPGEIRAWLEERKMKEYRRGQ